MKFISAQPDSDYFVWQVRVQMNNFKKFDIEKDAIVLFAYDKKINPNAKKLLKETKATIIFIQDKRTAAQRNYIPSVRPHIIKEFFGNYRNLVDGHDIFYHDCDIIFSSLPDFNTMSQNGEITVSDTISYLGAHYINSKGKGLLEEMCSVVGIEPDLVVKNEKKTGGAQYYIPSSVTMDYVFWNKIERDSIALFDLMVKTSKKYTPSHPIQSWTADMWALLWSFWAKGYDSVISKELAFSWPTLEVEKWNEQHIFHNAGVTPDRGDLFYKGAFIKASPFNSNHENVSPRFCSIKYVEEIMETAKLLKK